MDKDNEHHTQTSLNSLTDMASRMAHPSDTMEIIGIAAPEDAAALQQKTSDNNVALALPDTQRTV